MLMIEKNIDVSYSIFPQRVNLKIEKFMQVDNGEGLYILWHVALCQSSIQNENIWPLHPGGYKLRLQMEQFIRA